MSARNEARRLPRSLGSVRDWAGEIIVVTNDCADDTAAVAAAFGAKVSDHPFTTMSGQKSFALGLATQPWVLGLDADEEVSAGLRAEIREFLAAAPPDVNGAWCPRRLWFMDRWIRHGDVYPDRVLRLFRRGCAFIGGDSGHDRTEVDGKTVYFNNDLHHYSFDSIAAQVEKVNFFARFFVRHAVARGKKFSVLETLLRSWWRFHRAYFLRLGFLDGYPGFYLAMFSAFLAFIRYSGLYEYEINRRRNRGDSQP
jgi:glycosyltransferase involved in cell wall biosynthesis